MTQSKIPSHDPVAVLREIDQYMWDNFISRRKRMTNDDAYTVWQMAHSATERAATQPAGEVATVSQLSKTGPLRVAVMWVEGFRPTDGMKLYAAPISEDTDVLGWKGCRVTCQAAKQDGIGCPHNSCDFEDGTRAPAAPSVTEGDALPDLPLPQWSCRDDLGGLVPSEIRFELKKYAKAYVLADRAASNAAWREYLKEGETPLARLQREIADSDTLATLLAAEKQGRIDDAARTPASVGSIGDDYEFCNLMYLYEDSDPGQAMHVARSNLVAYIDARATQPEAAARVVDKGLVALLMGLEASPELANAAPEFLLQLGQAIATQAKKAPDAPTVPAAPDSAREANADRYQWLLDTYAIGDGFDDIDSALNYGEAEKLNAAIDAAILATKGKA